VERGLARHIGLELSCGCSRAERPEDVGVPVELAQVRPVRRFLVARRLELVELLDGFLVHREKRAEVAGRVDRVRRPARDRGDLLGLVDTDLRRMGGELFARQSFRSAAASGEDEHRRDERSGSHARGRSMRRSDGSAKPKRR
jgi:hypothetical protein